MKVAREDQRADGLSKQYTSPVENADSLERVMGVHPAVTAYRELVHRKCNKRAAHRNDDEVVPEEGQLDRGERGEPEGRSGGNGDPEETGRAGQEPMEFSAWQDSVTEEPGGEIQAAQFMTNTVPFLQLGRGVPERLMARMGYSGEGGIGKKEDGDEDSLPIVIRPKCKGLGYVARTEGTRQDEVFLAERIRQALKKLSDEERWLFSTRLKGGPFHDLLVTDEELQEEMGHGGADKGSGPGVGVRMCETGLKDMGGSALRDTRGPHMGSRIGPDFSGTVTGQQLGGGTGKRNKARRRKRSARKAFT